MHITVFIDFAHSLVQLTIDCKGGGVLLLWDQRSNANDVRIQQRRHRQIPSYILVQRHPAS